jgi:trans-aconitate 2-methyltransferase
MPTWNPELYLLFEEHRTVPVRDLVARVPMERVNRIIDLGCGPGNSTAVLAERWPDASIVGLDNSAEMLENARSRYPRQTWVHGDISEWAATANEQYDLVFSNAALQWIGDHSSLYPALFAHVAPGGTFAVQVPYNWAEPYHRILCDLQCSSEWRQRLPPNGIRAKAGHDPGFYYDLLMPIARSVRIWETTYTVAMPGADSIAEWLKGTALRPFFDALPDETDRKRFVDDFSRGLRQDYRPRPDGNVLFPFRRLFLVASR